MHRIDTPTAQKDKFGQGKNGFTNGDPATGRRATDLNSDMWDAVQEEVCTVIEAAGIPLSKGEHTQLHAAIGRLIDEQVKTRLEKNQNGADIPNKPLFLQNVGLGETINRAADALQKSQNGGDIPDKTAFIEHLGMKETLNPTKRVSIGSIGTGAFDGSTPSINIGDSDSGFIGSADGVIDIYANNLKVGYIDSRGIHLNDQGLHIGDARMGADGNIWGTRWNASGQWLWDAIVEQLNTRGTIDWINNQLSIRDRNINTRAAVSQVIGIGQTYRVVTNKVLGVTYTNTSQKPWVVLLKINLPASGEVQIKVNGVMAAGGNASNTAGVAVWAYPSAIVPAGATYVVESSWGNVIQWVELQ
ncbi:phage tail protein [Salmonella enterica]|uniref:phage tail protein n=1 Tax=Salmonella enterica TaxID=28901 RepID=UPI003743FEF6